MRSGWRQDLFGVKDDRSAGKEGCKRKRGGRGSNCKAEMAAAWDAGCGFGGDDRLEAMIQSCFLDQGGPRCPKTSWTRGRSSDRAELRERPRLGMQIWGRGVIV